MLQLVMTLIATVLILLLTFWAFLGQKRRPRPGEDTSPLPARKMHERLHLRALRSPWQGMGRLPRRAPAAGLMRSLLRAKESLAALELLRDECRSLLMPLMALQEDLRRAPRLPRTPAGQVRMMLLARELAAHSPSLDAPTLLSALEAWQEGGSVTLGERLALPMCLRLALAEQLQQTLSDVHEDLLAFRHGRRLARQAARAKRPMLLLTREHLSLPCAHALLAALRDMEHHTLLAALEELMGESGYSAAMVAEQHARRQSLLAGEISRILSALRTLDKQDWPALCEESDPLHRLFTEDPAGVYPRMDSDTRMLYRSRAASLARLFSAEEIRLARTALALCAEAEPDGLRDHVGWYLLEHEGMETLRRALHTRRGAARLWLGRRHTALYRALLTALAVLATLFFLQAGHTLWLAPLFLAVFGCVSRFVLEKLSCRLVPALPLPRMHVEQVDETMRTLIVIPAVIRDHTQAVPLVRRLLLARKAFPQGAVDCLLLCDYADSLTQTSHGDRLITESMLTAIAAVDGDGGSYLYLQRSRAWDQDQHAFIGRERKRGALETLNRLIAYGECEDLFDASTVPPAYFHRRYAYVLTLDSDTTPAPDALLPLLGALTHPLNERRHTPEGMRGVSILQPRMEVDPDTVRTGVSLLEGGAGGVDPYGAGAGSLWQRLCSRGNFEGKGLYRPDALLESTDGWILPDTVLSHDLLEGELSGCAQDAACAFYDGHPATLAGWMRRLHRWTRGDWQLLPWLLPYVKTPRGVQRNPLSPLSRFKIRENLRRSLVPLCQVLLLLYAALRGDALLGAFSLLAPEIPCLWPVRITGLLRLCAHVVHLPLRAAIRADAAAKALWRTLIRHEKRLDWVPAAHSDGGELSSWENWSQWGCALLLAALCVTGGRIFWPGMVLGGVFALFPLTHTRLDAPLYHAQKLTASMDASLIDAAEATWRFFEETVTEKDNHLPPDNLQVKPWRGLARRTSPTNIGMYLLSCLAAREMGLIDTGEMVRRVSLTMDTLEKLPLWHGLCYNWYATDDLRVLEPHLISSVDCGNLCACLIALAQGLRTYLPETDEEHAALSGRVDDFAARMELHRLFDPAAQLFFIGIDTDKAQPDQTHYDLFACEAQMLSFVAVMRREVPLRHFARLNRTVVRTGLGTPYVSWSGTAFEYMMPRLLLPVSHGTMMEHTVLSVLRAQKKRGVEGMFGVSESGWWGFDAQMNYRYHAFGLPENAMGPGTFHPVISPYAAALFLPFAPKEAHESLTRLRSRGMLGRLGFFESIDFDPAHLSEGATEAMVQSHMAHHQGMLLCAICNALTGNVLTRHFASVPEAAAFTLLLKEKRLPRLTLPPRALHPEAQVQREPSFRRMGQPLTTPVDAHMVGSPESMLLLSAQGTGVLRSRGVELTRFTGDPTQVEGPQFYVSDGKDIWRMGDPALPGESLFTEGSARLTRTCGPLQCSLTALTDPVQGAFLHVVEVVNLSTREKTVDIASCLVPEMQPAASPHPAYSDLFIESARPEERVLTLTRRPKNEGDRPLTLCHAVSTHEMVLSLTAETDRMAFQGRNHTLHRPASLMQPMREGLIGAPITPCASFRLKMSIPGRARTAVVFITRLMPPGERFSLEALSPRLTDVGQLLALSRLQSRTMTESLPITQGKAAELSRLFGLLMWGHQPHQGAVSPLTQPPAALHALGIPTHRPILTVMLHALDDAQLLHDAAHAACWLKLLGQPVTLCCLCEGDRAAQVKSKAEEMLCATLLGRDTHDSAVLLCAPELEDGVMETIQALSRAILYEGSGTLTAQVEQMEIRHAAQPLPRVAPDAPPLPQEPLRFDNGLGGFQPQTDDYVIRLENDLHTPAPWCSLLTGERLGNLCMESGFNMTFAGNSHLHRLTAWSNDPVCPTASESVYLSDVDSGALFSPTPLPLGQGMACRVAFTPGGAVWRAMGYGVESVLSAAVIPGTAFSARTLRLKNMTQRDKHLTVAIAARFVMGRNYEDEALCCLTPIEGGVVAHSPAMQQAGCVSILEGPCVARRMSAASFFGLHGGMPGGLFSEGADESGSVAVLSLSVTLPAQGSADVTWLMGACRQMDELERVLRQVRASGASAVYRSARQKWAQRLSTITVSTPDDSLNLLINRMLPWQVRASRIEGRCGFYQAGGAIGFRDQLQDMTALTLSEPQKVRAHILLCARRQYIEGDVQHWWHPPRTGVRTRITDDRLFLPFMTCWYIQRTGDKAILREQAPWLMGEKIPDGAEDLYHTPYQTQETDTLFVHCLRALTSIRLGPQGLPLMEGGDWNDGMNRVRGESVWLGMFYAYVLKAFADLAEGDTQEEILTVRRRLIASIEAHGWDGGWYRRAYFDDLAPLGSAQSPECRIDSLCQSWAVLALGVTERSAQAMENAWQQLYDPRHGLMKLLTPPFDGKVDAGYIGGYLPGVRENGGQYTHAAAWMLWALCDLGWADRAWELVRALNPIHHADTPERAARYRLEPYALAGDVYANPQHMGRGGWSHYTGSAAWLYTIVLEKLLGFEKRGDRVRLRPLFPSGWDDFTITLQFGASTWHFTAARDSTTPTLDGDPAGEWITLKDDGKIHQVRTRGISGP